MPTQIIPNRPEPLDETLNVGNETADGQVIKAQNGGGLLDLRANSTNNNVLLTNSIAGQLAYVSMTNLAAELGFNDPTGTSVIYLDASLNELMFRASAKNCYVALGQGVMGIRDVSLQSGTSDWEITIINNSAASVTQNSRTNQIVFINSGIAGTDDTGCRSGISRSVAISGKGLDVNTDDTIYFNQMSMQFPGNSFNTFLRPSNATSDQAATIQDDTGILAYTKNIPVSQYAEDLDSAVASITRVFAAGITTFTITHTYNTLDLKPQIFELSTGETVYWTIRRTSTSTIEVSRAGNIANGLYRILI